MENIYYEGLEGDVLKFRIGEKRVEIPTKEFQVERVNSDEAFWYQLSRKYDFEEAFLRNCLGVESMASFVMVKGLDLSTIMDEDLERLLRAVEEEKKRREESKNRSSLKRLLEESAEREEVLKTILEKKEEK